MKPAKLYKRPTRDGLWHPVKGGKVNWPVEVNISRFVDVDENGNEQKIRTVSIYNYGSEERSFPEDFGADTLWLRYRTPKVTR